MRDRWVGYFVMFLGIDFLLGNLDLPHLDLGKAISVIWPLALVWVGWTMIRKERDAP